MVSSEHRTRVPTPNRLGGDEVTSEGGGGTAPFPLDHVHLCRPPDAASTEEGGAIKVRGQDGNIWRDPNGVQKKSQRHFLQFLYTINKSCGGGKRNYQCVLDFLTLKLTKKKLKELLTL